MCLLMYLIFCCYCYASVVHQFFRQHIYIFVVHLGAFKTVIIQQNKYFLVNHSFDKCEKVFILSLNFLFAIVDIIFFFFTLQFQ